MFLHDNRRIAQVDEQEETDKPVTVTVNGRPVTLPGHRVSGLQIKQAAVEQGVPIQLDFVLSEELGDHRTKIVGDTDIVSVLDRSRFVAIPPDDNS
jgi:hypothetical protein